MTLCESCFEREATGRVASPFIVFDQWMVCKGCYSLIEEIINKWRIKKEEGKP
jgi:hypothetical protein